MRLIDADALMENYNLKEATKYGNRDAEQQAHSYNTLMMYEVADMIEDAPTVNDWIPCAERQPEEPGRYLVSYGKNTYTFIEEWDGHCFSERNYIAQPKAWMELPGEYKGE